MLNSENIDIKIENFWPKNGPAIQEVKKYINKYSEEKIVIKCGGRVLLDPKLLDILVEDLATLKKLGLNPLLVHGGGLGIKKKLDALNIESKFIMGLRVTDEKMITIVEDVMTKFNKEIVSALEKKSCKAKSMSIKENNVIYVKQESKELGYVGRPDRIDKELLEKTIKQNFIPIITPMGVDESGQAFNINGDTAAGALAMSLKARRLLLVTDVKGILDKKDKLLPEIESSQAKKLIDDQTIHGGMIPKIKTCIDAVNNGVRGVVIIDGRRPHSILFELFSDQGAGTLIRK